MNTYGKTKDFDILLKEHLAGKMRRGRVLWLTARFSCLSSPQLSLPPRTRDRHGERELLHESFYGRRPARAGKERAGGRASAPRPVADPEVARAPRRGCAPF